ncbi:MAG: hypothetical protein IKH19_04135 [Muribaculaceae bacterium]|nr:hypothetical protein [Muribaculaceae bacterium]
MGNKFYTLEQSQVQTDNSSLNGEYIISIDTGIDLDEEYREEAFKLNVTDVLPISSRVRFTVDAKDVTPEILQAVKFLSESRFFYSDIDNGTEFLLTDLPGQEVQTAAINLGLVQVAGDRRVVRIPAFTKGYTSERMKVMAQENALFGSPEFAPSELRAYAKAAAYKLSDIVTKIQSGGSEAIPYLGPVDADKFKGKERIEIIQSFGLQRLYRLLKIELFEIRVLPTRKQRRKVDAIRANFQAFMELGFGTLRDLENIEIADGNNRVKDQGISLFTEEEEQQIQELYGNSLEHWQVGFRSVSTFASLSQQLKHMLDTFKDLDGTGDYKMNGLEMPENINVQTAVSLILSWCSDCQNVDQMIEKLKARVPSNPWVLQLVNTDPNKKDSTGRTIGLGVLVQGTPESERIKSLFFSNFKKYFQPYTIIYKDKDGRTLMKEINKGNKADEIFSTLDSTIKMNTHPAFNNGIIKDEVLNKIGENYKKLPVPTKYLESSEEDKDAAIDAIIDILNILGINAPERDILEAYLRDNYEGVRNSIAALYKLRGLKIEKSTKNIDGIKGLVNRMSSLIDAGYEAVSYEAGKLYYSYVYPSYLSNLTETLQGRNMTEDEYRENLESLFDSEWFKEEVDTIDGKRLRFRTPWLRDLYENSSDARKAFKHVVCLKGFGETYSDKSFASYTATMVANYFYDDNKKYAYYRVPIMSNKPSEEYIRFYRTGESTIIRHLINDIFTQEIDRIVTVKERLDSGGRIANFDSNNILEGGRKFHFLDYLNPYVKAYMDYMSKSNSDMSVIPAELFEEGNSYLLLGGLLYKKMEGYKLSEENNETGLLTTLLESTIKYEVNRRFQSAMDTWKRKGFIIPIKNKKGEITKWDTKDVHLGSTYEDIERAMREFYWNDMFAAINILELTINDPAFYRDAEDLQKRLAQIHAPGTRMNLDAVDTWNSSDKTQTLFSDGIFRFVTINDENVISGCYNQVKELFESQLNQIINPAEKALFKAQMDRTLEALSEITHTDGQGYSSPTAYRKKLGMLGRWTDAIERAYQEILNGNLTTQNMQLLMQPLKPFAYGNVIQRGKGPISKLRVGTQIKDSEYALIIADALLRGAGVKSKLSAIFDVMEESHGLKKVNGKWTGVPNGKGIDTVVFNSAVKTGNFGVLNLDSDNPYKTLRDAVYFEGGPEYNTNFVKEIGFENYIIQQEVPAHFEGEQQLGSQTRALIFADLRAGDIITVGGEDITVKDAREEFFKLQAANVEESFQILSKELGLDQKDIKLQNIAISKILRKSILADSRFGSDLLWACSTNKDGEFNISLTDPTQSVRVQQLLNSVIKNRINKQEMPGGPVVQVSSFGADELKIVYNSKEGKLMLSEKQFNELKQGQSFSSDKYTLPEENETYKQYLKKQAGIAYYEAYAPIYDPALLEFEKPDGTIDVEAIEKVNPDMLKLIGYRIPTEARYSMAPIKIVGFLPRNAGEAIIMPSEWVAQTGSDFDGNNIHLMRLSFRKKNNRISIWVRSQSARAKRNDRSFQIMWGVLTSEAAAPSIITQGGAFERTKKQAYGIAAVKEGTLSYEDIEGKKIKELKTLFYKEKNLIYNDVHTGFFEQNMIAAKLIGIFAQANVSHAFISMSDKPVYITLKSEFKFIYNDKNGNERKTLNSTQIYLDEVYGLKGQKISSVLAELFASSVDAVKDPILNLLQINIDTANIVVTLARMGFDIDQIVLITSQPVVREVLDVMQSEDTYLEHALYTVLDSKTKDSGSDVVTGVLSEEMLIKGLTENDDKIDIEILNFLSGILEASRFISVITHMTRYNSVASAVGPRASNTSYQMKQDDTFYDKISSGEISPSIVEAINNPVLAAFRERSHYLAENILAPRIIEATPGFRAALNVLERITRYTTESILSQFADFFTSWMVQNNYIPIFSMSYERRMYMHSEFSSKIVEKKAQYPDIKFLQAILFVQRGTDQCPNLEIRIKGLTNEDIEDLKSSWDALYDIEPQLAIELFEYAYNRGSFGFNPKTFINLTPNRIKKAVGDGIYISNTEKALKDCNSTLPVDMLTHVVNQFLLHHPNLIPSLDSESLEFENSTITPEYGQNTYVKSKDPLQSGAPLGLYKTTIQGKEVPVYITMDNYRYHLHVLDYLGGAGRGFEIDTTLGRFPKSVFTNPCLPKK